MLIRNQSNNTLLQNIISMRERERGGDMKKSVKRRYFLSVTRGELVTQFRATCVSKQRLHQPQLFFISSNQRLYPHQTTLFTPSLSSSTYLIGDGWRRTVVRFSAVLIFDTTFVEVLCRHVFRHTFVEHGISWKNSFAFFLFYFFYFFF